MIVKGKNAIFIRVFLLFGILVLSITFFFAFMIIPMQEKSFDQIMSTQGETVSRSIVQASSDAIIAKDFGFIVEHNVEVLKNNTSIHYILVSPKLSDKISIDQESWNMINKLPDNVTQLEQQIIAYKIMDVGKYKNVYHFVYPIQFSGIEWGWLHIGFSTVQYYKYLDGMYRRIIYMVSTSFVLIVIVGYLFARWIAWPITLISNLATRVAKRDLSVRSTIQRNDEIGVLSNSFNQMIDALSQSKKQLENYNKELEHQVTKRTHELAELNLALDQRIKNEVNKRQKQEALLIHQSRLAAMGEMIGAIAHQWRQPLNALGLVQQNLQLMYQIGKLDDDFMKNNMEKSERLIQKMSSTIDDFRNFFKPNKHAELFNVKVIVQSTAELLEAQLKNNNISLILNCEDNLNIKGFQGEFSQVILNLLNNAKDILMEHRPEQPTITINATNTIDGNVEVVIKDNGCGIPDAIFEKIYDPYFTTKEEGKGTGIGLYMSKIIVENNMSGTLRAFNDTEGANFVIEIGV